MRFIFASTLLCSLLACQKEVKKADFAGAWVNKKLIGLDSISTQNLKKDDIYLPLIAFQKEPQDSIKLYFSPDSVMKAWTFHLYDSYNLKLNEDKETMILFDYPTNEVFFQDRHRKTFQRYVKLSDSSKLKAALKSYFGKDLTY